MELQERLKTGNYNKIVVNIQGNKNYTKSVLKFKVYKTETVYIETTKFKVIKYLNPVQLELLELHKECKDLLEGNFNKRLEWNMEYKTAEKNNVLTRSQIAKKTMLDAIKKIEYLELI